MGHMVNIHPVGHPEKSFEVELVEEEPQFGYFTVRLHPGVSANSFDHDEWTIVETKTWERVNKHALLLFKQREWGGGSTDYVFYFDGIEWIGASHEIVGTKCSTRLFESWEADDLGTFELIFGGRDDAE